MCGSDAFIIFKTISVLAPGAAISVLTPAATDGGGRGSSLVMIVNSPGLLGVLRSFLLGRPDGPVQKEHTALFLH